MDLKGKIGLCDFFIGARTHSTIAAYSQCIPTLVMGYSVKSVGIAQDLFGSWEKYVIPVNTLEDADALVAAFRWLVDNQDSMRAALEQKVPMLQKQIVDSYRQIV
jgi:polysaccharide pyruvyl transferase WcaK-like protein